MTEHVPNRTPHTNVASVPHLPQNSTNYEHRFFHLIAWKALICNSGAQNKRIENLAIKASIEFTCVTDTSFKIDSAAKLQKSLSELYQIIEHHPHPAQCPISPHSELL